MIKANLLNLILSAKASNRTSLLHNLSYSPQAKLQERALLYLSKNWFASKNRFNDFVGLRNEFICV